MVRRRFLSSGVHALRGLLLLLLLRLPVTPGRERLAPGRGCERGRGAERDGA